MQTANVNIPIEKTTPVSCEECGSTLFREALFVRRVSKFIIGAAKDLFQPVPTLACLKCGHINEEFQIKELEAE